MIQLTDKEILFSQPNAALLADGDSRKNPVTRELLSAHICPWCGVLAQAVYKTAERIKDVTQEAFGLDKPLSPSKMAVSTLKHQVQPKFKSYLIGVGGDQVEMLREESHFSIASTIIFGQCKCKRAVYFPGQFDLVRYLFGLAKIVTSVDWYQADAPTWSKLVQALAGVDPELNEQNAQQFFNEIKSRVQIADDVTGNGPPVWLTSKGDWGYGSMSTAINRLVVKESN